MFAIAWIGAFLVLWVAIFFYGAEFLELSWPVKLAIILGAIAVLVGLGIGIHYTLNWEAT